MPPELGFNRFQERPSGASGASRTQENLLAAVAPPRTLLGNLQPSTIKNHTPAVDTSRLWLQPFGPHS